MDTIRVDKRLDNLRVDKRLDNVRVDKSLDIKYYKFYYLYYCAFLINLFFLKQVKKKGIHVSYLFIY